MFYLRTYFLLLRHLSIRGLLLAIGTLLVMLIASYGESIEKNLKNKLVSNSDGAYFISLISNKEDILSIRNKIQNLPGVERVAIIEESELDRDLKEILGKYEITLPSAVTVDYIGFKIVFFKDLKKQSQELVVEYVSHLAGKDNVISGEIIAKEKGREEKILENFQQYIYEFCWPIAIFLWSLIFALTKNPTLEYAYIVENYQRRKLVALKTTLVGIVIWSLVLLLGEFIISNIDILPGLSFFSVLFTKSQHSLILNYMSLLLTIGYMLLIAIFFTGIVIPKNFKRNIFSIFGILLAMFVAEFVFRDLSKLNAAVNTSSIVPENISTNARFTAQKLEDLKRDVETINKGVLSTSLRIKKLEGNLNSKNSEYVSILKKRQMIEEEFFQLKKFVDDNSLLLLQKKTEIERLLKILLLSSISKSSDEKELSKRYQFITLLKKKIELLQRDELDLQSLNQKLNDLSNQVGEFKSVEGQISQTLFNLENERKNLIESYKVEIAEKGQNNRAEKNPNAKKQVHQISEPEKKGLKSEQENLIFTGEFIPPLNEYQNITYKDRGITFNVKTGEEVFASRAGKIAYVGNLSTYGNVVMIDHGDDVRSIILGHFTPQVAKGDLVQLKGVVGIVDSKINTKESEAQIYFEVRKKNKVQKTISLMAKSFLDNIHL